MLEPLGACGAVGMSTPSAPTRGLQGLFDGPHHMRLCDAQGRLVLATALLSQAGRSEALPFTASSRALYVLIVDHKRTATLPPRP